MATTTTSLNPQAKELAMTPTCTFFDRSAMPTNLLTVPEWRRLSKAAYSSINWANAARKWAMRNGGALVWRADDSLVVFTRREGGKVSRSTYAPGRWRWAA